MTPIVGFTMSVGHSYDQNYRGELFIDDCKWKVGKKESASFCQVAKAIVGGCVESAQEHVAALLKTFEQPFGSAGNTSQAMF